MFVSFSPVGFKRNPSLEAIVSICFLFFSQGANIVVFCSPCWFLKGTHRWKYDVQDVLSSPFGDLNHPWFQSFLCSGISGHRILRVPPSLSHQPQVLICANFLQGVSFEGMPPIDPNKPSLVVHSLLSTSKVSAASRTMASGGATACAPATTTCASAVLASKQIFPTLPRPRRAPCYWVFGPDPIWKCCLYFLVESIWNRRFWDTWFGSGSTCRKGFALDQSDGNV